MFIGRQREQEQILGWLQGPGLVTLRGPPGVGKSALADRIAARMEGEGWQVLRASLLGAAEATAAVQALLRALGRKSSGDWAEDLAAVVGELREPRRLALIDDVEGEAVIGVVGALEGTRECTLLVCAPSALGLQHERVLPVEPLSEGVAAALLMERVERAGGSLVEAEARALVGRASGLPLVLELLAPQVAAVGAVPTLAALRRDGLDARLLSRAFARAQAALSPAVCDALGALGALEGDFTAERALAVIGGEQAFEHFLTLCRASWVWKAPSGRFQLLPSVRDVARPLAAPEVRARRCAAVLASLPAREDEGAVSQLVADRDELEAAWRLALEVDEGEGLGRLALAADLVFVRAGPFDRHLDLLDRSLAARSPTPAQRLRLNFAVGRAHALRGLHQRALPAYVEARALIGDPDAPGRLTATCAALMAFSLRPMGRLEEARAEARRALACAAGDLDRLAAAEMAVGVVELGAGELAPAEAAFSRAAALARLVEAPRMEGLAHANLALAHLEAGEAEGAGRAAAQARACLSAAGDSFQLARVLHMEGRVHLLRGELEAAEQALGRAAEAAARERDIEFDLLARRGLVELALARGQGEVAASRFAELAALSRVVEDVAWPGRLAVLAGRVARAPQREVLLRLGAEGRLVQIDRRALDFGRRGPLRRVLVALARARLEGAALSPGQVLEAGWPGERMLPESGAARVYMAVRRLRELGLEGTLLTSDAGYFLAPHCRVELALPEGGSQFG